MQRSQRCTLKLTSSLQTNKEKNSRGKRTQRTTSSSTRMQARPCIAAVGAGAAADDDEEEEDDEEAEDMLTSLMLLRTVKKQRRNACDDDDEDEAAACERRVFGTAVVRDATTATSAPRHAEIPASARREETAGARASNRARESFDSDAMQTERGRGAMVRAAASSPVR